MFFLVLKSEVAQFYIVVGPSPAWLRVDEAGSDEKRNAFRSNCQTAIRLSHRRVPVQSRRSE